ncbi:hypothetical protein JCM18899A_53640 [Nocardioides sp. AN3]
MRDEPFDLARVADRLAIEHVISRHVHAIDARDYERLDDVFTPDCAFDLSDAGGPVAPWAEVKPYYRENLGVVVHYFHAFTNLLLELDGDTARSSCKAINPIGMVGPEGRDHHFEIVGHYDTSGSARKTAGASRNDAGGWAGSGGTTRSTVPPAISSRPATN